MKSISQKAGIGLSILMLAFSFHSVALAAPFPPLQQIVVFHSDSSKPHSGWQKPLESGVSAGISSIQITYGCPAKFPIAVSGGFNLGVAAQSEPSTIAVNGPYFDGSKSSFGYWHWVINFPQKAPAHGKAKFDVYCIAQGG